MVPGTSRGEWYVNFSYREMKYLNSNSEFRFFQTLVHSTEAVFLLTMTIFLLQKYGHRNNFSVTLPINVFSTQLAISCISENWQ